MYKNFSETAREEGFDELADQLAGVAKIERRHEERYRKLLENLNENKVFERESEQLWECRNCGHVHAGESAPRVCPVCKHPLAYFELHKDNF